MEHREENRPADHSHAHDDHHRHPHDGGHEHSHSHEPSGAGLPARHEHGRGLTEIRTIINQASISATAKRTAIGIFEALGAAEAKIHAVPVERKFIS